MGLSTFLNGRQAVQLRGLAFLSLSDVGYIVAGSAVADGGGGAATTWTAGTVGIPCRIDPLSDRSDRSLIAGRIDERSTHLVTVPSWTNVTLAQRFAIGGRGTFEVTATRAQTAEPLTAFEVIQLS